MSEDTNNDNEAKSLDVEPTKKYFYFAVGKNGEFIHRIEHKYLGLIPIFKSMLVLNPNGSNTPETAVPIKPSYIRGQCKKNRDFWINTPELFAVIMKYVAIWSNDNMASANYVPKDVVQTGYANQLIKRLDLQLILKYVSDQIDMLDEETKSEMEGNLTIKKYQIISCLNPLLRTADGFLGMDGFADKIYVYIATIIWNCSLMDLDAVSDDPYFKELQAEQLAQWNQRNENQIHQVLEGDTVGSIDPETIEFSD